MSIIVYNNYLFNLKDIQDANSCKRDKREIVHGVYCSKRILLIVFIDFFYMAKLYRK